MALSEELLKIRLKALFLELSQSEDFEKSLDELSTSLSSIIVETIKSADVIVNAGQSVTVATPSGVGTGSTVAPGTGTLQ